MTVRTEVDGPVWTVVLDRPEVRNAVDPPTADALHEAFVAFDADADARVAVLHGEGGAFCAGWDLAYAASLAGDDTRVRREVVERLDPGATPGAGSRAGSVAATRGAMGPTRLELDKPVIATIEGPAVAGGMELALWADVRVMAVSASMGVLCRRWGVPLVDGGTFRLPRLVGEGRAMELVLTGRSVPAEECLRIGLCERVVADGGARAAGEAMAHDVARFPQLAVRADRRSVRAGHGLPVAEALRREWVHGLPAAIAEGLDGAARFAAGHGRGGDRDDV